MIILIYRAIQEKMKNVVNAVLMKVKNIVVKVVMMDTIYLD